MMKRDISVNVPNQFYFNAYSTTACVPISIQSLFHMYEALVEHGEMLSDEQWHKVLENGSILWRRWKALPGNEKHQIPTLYEILAMDESRTFNRKFGTQPLDYGGLVKHTVGCSDGSDSLLAMVQELTKQTKPACALVILPVNICISLVCRRDKNTPNGYAIFMFDSHGKKATRVCELVQFYDYRLVVTHLIEKYDIRSFDRLSRATHPSCSETEIATDYGYHALLFVQ